MVEQTTTEEMNVWGPMNAATRECTSEKVTKIIHFNSRQGATLIIKEGEVLWNKV